MCRRLCAPRAGIAPHLYGLNSIGLKRQGFTNDRISALKQAYELLFRSGLMMAEAMKLVREEFKVSRMCQEVVAFVEGTKRGHLPIGRGGGMRRRVVLPEANDGVIACAHGKWIGLIAGNGRFPIIFADNAKRLGYSVSAVAHIGETAPSWSSMSSGSTGSRSGSSINSFMR